MSIKGKTTKWVALQPETVERVKTLAKDQHRTFANMLEHIVEKYLELHDYAKSQDTKDNAPALRN